MYGYINNACSDWQAVIIQTDTEIQAVFPFVVQKKWGQSYFYQPLFTQSWGVFFKPMNCKVSKEFDTKKKYLKEILHELKFQFTVANFNCSPTFDYPLPFLWDGYTLTSKYTYQIDTSESLDKIWSGTAEGIRRDIKKANQFNITIHKTVHADAIIDLFKARKGDELRNVKSEDFERLRLIFKALCANEVAHGMIATDANNRMIAGIIVYEFKNVTTYFFGTSTLDSKTSGAMSLLLWSAIEKATENFQRFDFEGSMIESIERYFRGFGAKPIMYLNVSKAPKLNKAVAVFRP